MYVHFLARFRLRLVLQLAVSSLKGTTLQQLKQYNTFQTPHGPSCLYGRRFYAKSETWTCMMAICKSMETTNARANTGQNVEGQGWLPRIHADVVSFSCNILNVSHMFPSSFTSLLVTPLQTPELQSLKHIFKIIIFLTKSYLLIENLNFKLISHS